MKITTKKIIRELEEKYNYNINHLTIDDTILIRDVRDIINEILIQQKNIKIK